MRIVTFEPFLTELVCALGRESDLVGISRQCDFPPSVAGLPRVTGEADDPRSGLVMLSRHPVLLDELVALQPDLVLTTLNCLPEEAATTAGAVTESLRAR